MRDEVRLDCLVSSVLHCYTDFFLFSPSLSLSARYAVELQWLGHLLDYENLFEIEEIRAVEGLLLCQVKRHNRNIFSMFFNMKVYCVFSLESPQRGDSNEYTQYTISQYKKEVILNCPKSATMVFVPMDKRTSSKQPW